MSMFFRPASHPHPLAIFFFFNDTATTEIYTLSLHDALPIFGEDVSALFNLLTGYADGYEWRKLLVAPLGLREQIIALIDRKSTRLNSSHSQISYAVFCLKKKKEKMFQSFVQSLEVNRA